jgi:hypothetical protein
MNFFKFWKKKSPNEEEQLEKQESQEEIESEIQVEENYLKGTSYEQYLFKKKQRKKRKMIERHSVKGFSLHLFHKKKDKLLKIANLFLLIAGIRSVPPFQP